MQGQLEEAAHQLEFLKEVQQSLGKSEVRANRQGWLPYGVSSRGQSQWRAALLGPASAPGSPASLGSRPQTSLPQVLVFLQALVASKKQKPEQEATALLKEAVELHFSSMQGLALSPEYFEKLDPLFLVCIAKEYLHFCPKQVRGMTHLLGRGLKYKCDWTETRALPGQPPSPAEL